ncbi:hypothetical protein COBT_003739, partial [Conglomerata obtusa]
KNAFELGHNADYIAQFFNKAMHIVDTIEFDEYETKLGNANYSVEVDETHIVSRRDSRGKILAGER